MAGGMQGGYAPPPAPARRAGNTGIWLWSLVGCGVIALLVVIIGGVMVSKLMKGDAGKSIMGAAGAMKSADANFEQVAAALEKYQKDNGGKYPPKLDALIPTYIADKALLTSGGENPHPMEYNVPKADADGHAVVLRLHVSEVNLTFPVEQKQSISLVLLKSGEIDQEQVARTNLSAAKHLGGRSDSK